MKKLTDIVRRIMSSQISVPAWIFSASGILMGRFFLELFSSGTMTGAPATDFFTLLHYLAFFLSTALILTLLLHVFARITISEAKNLILFGLLITWTPPLIDFFLSFGRGFDMAYLFLSPVELWGSFTHFFGPFTLPGITPGIRFEILIVLIGFFLFVKWRTKSYARAGLGTFVVYFSLFLLLALPSVIFAFAKLFGADSSDTLMYFFESARSSLIAKNLFHDTIRFTPSDRYLEVYFNGAMLLFYFPIILLLTLITLVRSNFSLSLALLKNIRPARLLHFFLLAGIGMWLAISGTIAPFPTDLFSLLSIFSLLGAMTCAWIFAVFENDRSDTVSDAISNPDRPIVAGNITPEKAREISITAAVFALFGASIAGHEALYAILVFLSAYGIYSIPPLRLKRFPFIPSFLIALAALSCVFAGFFLLSTSPLRSAFPNGFIFAILFAYTFGATVRDLKDIAGDKKEGIPTLPVLLGEKRGFLLTAIFFAAAFLAIPLFTGQSIFRFPALLAALAAFPAVLLKPYREWRVFAVLFAFIGLCVSMAVLSIML